MESEAGSPSKEALRRELAGRLDRLAPADSARAAARVAERVLGLPELAGARRVLSCLSFGSELDTVRLIDRLRADGRQVHLPRADPRDRRLHVHPYPCPLETLRFGLRQPTRAAVELDEPTLVESIDLVLVLGLAFDRRGYRLGYGGGYFDRFFARHPIPGVGLAFDFQIVDRLPIEEHDLPMAVVVTESEEIRPLAS
jgi:5-formyltetrahydrofolate cyclo-ligase